MDEGSYDVEELAQSYLDIPKSFPRQLDYTFFKNNYDDILSVAMTGLGEGKKEYYKDAEADDAEHIDALEKDMADDKKSSKMKTSELKAKIKEMVLAEMALDVDNMEDAPESEVDFLAEVDAILAEADEFETAKPARITSFLKALDLLVYDEYHAELYDSDEVKQAYDLLVKAAKKLGNLNEAEEEVAVDDTEVAVDGEENIDVDTTTEVDPNVKAVQDALTQAQAAAQKLGDPKLTDQIGNTITFFTRTHVVDKGAVAEADEMEEGKKEYYDDAESDDAAHINALEKDMKDDKDSSMKIKEVVFPMWQRIK